MEEDLICEICGAHLSEHEIDDREAPSSGRTDGVFAGQPWKGLHCPDPYVDVE